MKVNIIEKSRQKVAYLRHHGTPERVFETVAKFIEWRKTTGLSPINSSKTYGIPYSDPELATTSDFIFDVAGSVDLEVPENLFGVKNAELPAGKYAVVRHIGSHEKLKETVSYIFQEWLPDQAYQAGDFPIYFQYLNFIHQVDEYELMTDVFLLLR